MLWQGVIRVELDGPDSPELVKNMFVESLANAINFSISSKKGKKLPRRGASSPKNVVAESLCLRSGSAGESWGDLRKCMRAAGKRFREENGRPAVLVIDGVEFLKEDEKFMAALVGFAKVSARRPQSVTEQRACGLSRVFTDMGG